MATYCEIQYYDGGLRTMLLPRGDRPRVLPPSSGLKSTEAELTPGSLAVEMLVENREGCYLTWIGCYASCIDRQHGARGNFCGVGVWMVDIAPIHVSNLLKSLSDATSIVSKNNGPTQQVCDKLEHLANNFDDFGLSLPIDHLPSQLWSGRFGDQPPRTAYVVASDGLGLDLNLVAADILQQFTRKDHVDAARRRVYMSARNSKIASDNTVALDYGAALKSGESAIWDFAEATAESSLKQNEMLERQRAAAQAHTQALNESRETADRLGQANARLQSDLEEANAAREAMSNVFDMVEAHLSRSRSNKRGEPALALPSQMPATDSNLLKDVYSIVKANRATLSSIDETLKRRSKRKDDPPNPQPKEDDIAPSNAPMVWLKEMLVVGGVAAALVVIALLFWFNLDDFLRLVRSVV